MSHTVVFKLNKPANEFAAGESIGFNVRGGVQYYDRKTKQKEWTNYSAVVFAKKQTQIDFYRERLIENAIVEVSSKQIKIDVYDGQNGQSLSIDMIDAWIGSINQSAPRVDNQNNQNNQQQAAQGLGPKVEHTPNNPDNFDSSDDIPF